MQGREQLTLDLAIRRAASAGTLVRHEAVAVFLEVLRLAAESEAIPDAAATLLEEEGTLAFRPVAGAGASDPAEPIRAACRLASRLFAAARLEPPLALAGAAEAAPARFPTLRHLRDAFELELLLSGTSPPTEVERRMAIAAVMAKARQSRGTSAGSPARRRSFATDPPRATDPPFATDPPHATDPPFATDPPRATDPPFATSPLPPTDPPPATLRDPSTRITEPPGPAARPGWRWPALLAAGNRTWLALLAAAHRERPRWLPLATAAALGIAVGVLLGRGTSRQIPAAAGPVPAALVPEIALPPPDVKPPAIADTRAPPARAAPPVGALSPEGSPRPVRKLRRRAAAVAEAESAAGAKLQLGDESLKQGRFFEALMAFREALDQDPPVPAAARRLGDAYREHQDTDLAVAAYERYLELAPSAPDADEVRAAVEQLRSSTPLAR